MLLLPPHTRDNVVSEILRAPYRFVAACADVVVVEGLDEELEDEEAAGCGDDGVEEEEVRKGCEEDGAFLSLLLLC